MNPLERILIIEDESPMRMALTDCLQTEGYRVISAADGESGLERAIKEKPDLILLDIMMPRLDGFAVCSELRKIGASMPILMLTAKGLVADRVKGLKMGADDYLVKPFSTDELLARVGALLRRDRSRKNVPKIITIGDVEIDFTQLIVTKGRDKLHFTAKEFAMLRLLVEADGKPITRERFLDVVWNYASFPTTRTVDNHIASIRNKIERDPQNPVWIKTVHGVGYKLEQSD